VRTLLIGGRGQLGTALRARLTGEVIAPARSELDLCDLAGVSALLEHLRPAVVINAAAYNLVDRAEDEPETAFLQNAFVVRHLARAVDAIGGTLVHISTDHVFGFESSVRQPLRETDLPGPVSVYGASKLAGEGFVRSVCPRHFLLRTCGLYGVADSPGKGNFVGTMLRLGRQNGEVRVVDDQYCTPTRADDLARAIVELVPTGDYGLYHVTNAGEASWCGFAREIFRLAGIPVKVTPIKTADFAARARRPAWSVLAGDRVAGRLKEPMPHWKTALAGYLSARGELHRG